MMRRAIKKNELQIYIYTYKKRMEQMTCQKSITKHRNKIKAWEKRVEKINQKEAVIKKGIYMINEYFDGLKVKNLLTYHFRSTNGKPLIYRSIEFKARCFFFRFLSMNGIRSVYVRNYFYKLNLKEDAFKRKMNDGYIATKLPGIKDEYNQFIEYFKNIVN